jgi:hypothetical protein
MCVHVSLCVCVWLLGTREGKDSKGGWQRFNARIVHRNAHVLGFQIGFSAIGFDPRLLAGARAIESACQEDGYRREEERRGRMQLF